MIDVKVSNITKDYGENRGVFDISFKLQKGEIFGFVGTNGSGKTTTIRNIMGFINPNKGNIEIRGLDAHKNSTETKKYIGYVPGEIAFPDLSSGVSFIESQADFWKIKDLTYANELIRILQIDLTANPRKMSKGMKQKTAIVAALMNDPDILILDEPTTGLDPLMRKQFLEVLQKQKEKGKTILISSHIFEELEELCDRVALIKDGKIIDIAIMDEIRNPRVREYKIEFLGEKDLDNFLKDVKDSVINLIERKNQNQVIIKLKREQIVDLFKTLTKYDLKFISEIKYNLERFFREKFSSLEREEKQND